MLLDDELRMRKLEGGAAPANQLASPQEHCKPGLARADVVQPSTLSPKRVSIALLQTTTTGSETTWNVSVVDVQHLKRYSGPYVRNHLKRFNGLSIIVEDIRFRLHVLPHSRFAHAQAPRWGSTSQSIGIATGALQARTCSCRCCAGQKLGRGHLHPALVVSTRESTMALSRRMMTICADVAQAPRWGSTSQSIGIATGALQARTCSCRCCAGQKLGRGHLHPALVVSTRESTMALSRRMMTICADVAQAKAYACKHHANSLQICTYIHLNLISCIMKSWILLRKVNCSIILFFANCVKLWNNVFQL
jgi:hypothetical protein